MGHAAARPRRASLVLVAAATGVASLLPQGARAEALFHLPSGGRIGFATRGDGALRVRLLSEQQSGERHSIETPPPMETPMVSPLALDVPYQRVAGPDGQGIKSEVGCLVLSKKGSFALLKDCRHDATWEGVPIAESAPLSNIGDISLLNLGGRLVGRGGSPLDSNALSLPRGRYTPLVCNRASFAPYYYSTDGYAALGVVADTQGSSLAVSYENDDCCVRWSWTTNHSFELHLMPASSLAEATRRYYRLTGAPPVPPRYTFGFIASRWGWKDQAYVEDVVWRFRNYSYPADALIVDFEWFTPSNDYEFDSGGQPWYQDFSFNPALFPQPAEQLRHLRQDMNFRFGGIRKPRIGNTMLAEKLRLKGWILPGGEPAGEYPPDFAHSYAYGRSLNFSNPEVREWYSKELVPLLNQGVSFWWNDEGETDYFTYHWWNVAEADALRQVDPDRRFFSLNRAFTPGLQRLGAAVWTGDLHASWQDLQGTPQIMVQWAIAGAPYVACDIGGFIGEATSDLLVRWMQMGTFMPIMRVHSEEPVTPHFPWLFGEEAGHLMQEALNLRYRLVPYHYSLAHALYEKQTIYVRPMAMEFPDDPEVAELASQWMDGDLLAAPVLNAEGRRDVYLPAGRWYEFGSVRTMLGPLRLIGTAAQDEVPVFVRAGAIVPLGPVVQSTGELPGGPLEVQVYAGANGSFDMIEDDGETKAYEVGHQRRTAFRWSDSSRRLSWTVTGDLQAPGKHGFTHLRVVLRTAEATFTSGVQAIGAGGSIVMARGLKGMSVQPAPFLVPEAHIV